MASGLTALALMGVSRTLREQERMTGVRMRADRYWVVTTLGIVVGVLILGLTLGQLLAPDPFVRALGWLKPIWTFLIQVLLIIVFIFAYLFFSLLEPLLTEVQGRPARLPTFVSPLRPESIEELAAKEPVEVPPIFGTIMQILLVLGVIALIAFIFLAAVRNRKRRVRIEAEEILETRETILSMDLLRSQLSDLLSGLRRKQLPPLFLDPGPPDDPRRIVRELYQKVLARAIDLDLPRSKEQTPSAYQRTLARACAEERSSLETLTLIYLIARYGSVPPTHEQVREAQEAFARIDIVLQARVRQI
jgi:hypothetical protein